MQMAAYLKLEKYSGCIGGAVRRHRTSYSTPANVGRLVNLTQRKYAYMRPGPGFHGSLANVDVSGDTSIDHISIDKSPRLHARAISEVLAVIKGHPKSEWQGRNGAANPPPVTREETVVKVAPDGGDFARPVGIPAPSVKPSNGTTNSASSVAPLGESAPSLRSPTRRETPQSDRSSKTARLSHCGLAGAVRQPRSGRNLVLRPSSCGAWQNPTSEADIRRNPNRSMS